MRRTHLLTTALLSTALLTTGVRAADLAFVEWDMANISQRATSICKAKIVAIRQTKAPPAFIFDGTDSAEYEVTCQLLAPIKGEFGNNFVITFKNLPMGINPLKEGNVNILFLGGKDTFVLDTAITGVDVAVKNNFGNDPAGRLLAELVAKTQSEDVVLRGSGITELGMLRDRRAADAIKPSQNDPEPGIVRAAVIALYRMGVAPDAAKTMAVFNPAVMNVWYQESGIPQKDANGKTIMRPERGHSFMERGLPNFDYATYVREGIKLDWVRKDWDTHYTFFGVPWKVQRRECVPELMKLLDDTDQNVRSWAVECLDHTVNDKDGPGQLAFARDEQKYLTQWKSWWKDNGEAYMVGKLGT